MEISENTKVSVVIKHNKEAIEVIASLNPHFKKLRNPILRKVLAPRVTLKEAAKIGKCEIMDMLSALEKIGFQISNTEMTDDNDIGKELNNFEINDFIGQKKVVSLDVRPFLKDNKDPFLVIQDALKKCEDDEILEILVSFKPIPLIKIHEKKGYLCYHFEKDQVHHTLFKKNQANSEPVLSDENTDDKEHIKYIDQSAFDELEKSFGENVLITDVRNLEMPEPMVTILNLLEDIEDDQVLKVFHKKVPQYLLPELESKNLNVFIHDVAEGNVLMLIHK